MNKTTALVFFGIILLGLMISLVTLNTCSKPVELDESASNVPKPEATEPREKSELSKGGTGEEAKSKAIADSKAKEKSAEKEKGGMLAAEARQKADEGYDSPEAAMKALSEVFAKRDFEVLVEFVGEKALPKSIHQELREIVENPKLSLSGGKPFSEISKSADSVRWVLNFESDDSELSAEVYADLAETEERKTTISGISLPIDIAAIRNKRQAGTPRAASADPSDGPDAVAVAHAFSRAIVERDFETARALADPEAVTDERVAALMIAIEEGKFQLKDDRPFVVTLSREDITWVLSRLQSEGGASEFAVELGQIDGDWKVNGLTFSKVLSALARAAGGGGVAYSPIVEDPEGGDSLVLYFEFDEANVNSRGNRQLAIVADILSKGEGRVIRINGHADALGSDDYNVNLSNQRANSIREALISMGVSPEQVVTEGFGSTKPRRPNFNPDGSDNPIGRSENRRAEVYLDF